MAGLADKNHEPSQLLLIGQQSQDDSSLVEFERRIREKERDLELAAKIGRQLLDQNRELQERNEFLEESLQTSTDAVQQLQYQLQQRSALLNAFAEYDDQNFNSVQIPECSTNFVESLENRVKQLESENTKLKNELNQLRDTTDDHQERRVRNYLNQLEKANFKINKLHLQIEEKNKECCTQESEIQRLIKEIGRRKDRERMISQENVDLQGELANAVRNHEDLRSEIESLQEKYCEIMDVLNQTQDELKTARSDRVQKASSINSLYDSLASELEASDSGFYSTPMVSARSDYRNRSLEVASPVNGLQSELERLNRNASPINEIECGQRTTENNNCEASTSTDALKLDMSSLTEPEFYDLPSKAIVDAVKRSISADERRRIRSASHTPQSSTDKSTAKESRLLLKTAPPRGVSLQQTRRPNLEVFDEECVTNELKEEEVPDPQSSTVEFRRPASKTYRNVSCSPIRVETPPEEPTPRGPCTGNSSVFFPYSGATSYMPNSSEDTTSHLVSSSSPSSTSADEDETPRSSDSFQNYAGPRLGQPGSPGSRDLEYSLRKLQLYKKLEDDYSKFRKDRNLGSSHVQMRSAGRKPKLSTQHNLASLAANVGVIAHPNRPSALPIRQHRQHSEDSQNNNSSSRLSTGTSLRLNNEPSRPRTISRSASIGLQLLQHSNQQKHHLPRGIDNAVRERMPLVCGVLWRSVAPRQEQKERVKEEPARPSIPDNRSDLRRQVAGLSAASSSQIFDVLGLSPIRQDPSPLQILGSFLQFERKSPSNSTSLTDKLLNGNGLSAILAPTNSRNNTIIQRSSLNGRPF